jgi:hypothetical protein
MDKPREFWIWNFKIGPDESTSQNCLVNMNKGGSEWMPHTHVIEYSAYESLKEKLLTFEGMTFSENQEIIKLKEQNAILIDALKIYATPKSLDGDYGPVEGNHAREALKKVGVEG